jgi:hypothetical protein
MKGIIKPLIGTGLLISGILGLYLKIEAMSQYSHWLIIFGSITIASLLLKTTFYKSGTAWPYKSNEPKHLKISGLDYLKAFICWTFAFQRNYVYEPGLYYTGDVYDKSAPLLVTSNYHLTVFLVARRARAFNARILIIDTDGINVWCSAGKQQFNNEEILKQLDRYDESIISDEKKPTIILPKFGLAGIDLTGLIKSGLKPVIGPLYAKDIPNYLSSSPLTDRDDDRVHFGIISRVFSWFPGFLQFMGYTMYLVIPLMILKKTNVPWDIVMLSAFLATAYAFLFPWIPGKRFAVKGLFIAGFTTIAIASSSLLGAISTQSMIAAIFYTFATGLFVGLAFTGNSAVSNYSKVKLEITNFLPPTVFLYIAFIVVYFI